MYPIDTQDGLFHDGDGISELGTILPARWLNQVQQELIAVLNEAGIIPEKANTKQVVNAIKLIISNSTAKFATRLETSRNINGVPFDGTKDINVTPAGAVQFFAQQWPPEGWLKANGATVSRVTYANLFAAIGTHYGAGDGSTTFNLPDLRGEFLRAYDDGRGVDAGRVIGSFQNDMLAAHNHSLGLYKSVNAGIGDEIKGGAELSAVGIGGEIWGGPAGGNETRPRNVALLACIKI